MRGIQINNFFENHISLNGRKINNQLHAVINSHRPKPIVIQHGPVSPEPLLLTDAKSPQIKNRNQNSTKRKKRANTHTDKQEKKEKT